MGVILLVGGQKGGTGKSTVATNLAVEIKKLGRSVKLIDADPQGTSNLWSNLRNGNESMELEFIPCTIAKGQTVNKDILEESKNYEIVIVDAGGVDSIELRRSMLVAHQMIIPIRPSMADAVTLFKINQMVEEAQVNNENLRPRVLINGASPNPKVKEYEEALELCEKTQNLEVMQSMLCDRKAYRDALKLGAGISELTPANQKSVDEYQRFFEETLNA